MNNIREKARPVAFLMCIFTLCFLFILEGIGEATMPPHAYEILGGIAGAWLISREVSKRKGGE